MAPRRVHASRARLLAPILAIGRRRLRRRPRRLVGPLQSQHQLDQFFLAQALEVDPSHDGIDSEIRAQRKGWVITVALYLRRCSDAYAKPDQVVAQQQVSHDGDRTLLENLYCRLDVEAKIKNGGRRIDLSVGLWDRDHLRTRIEVFPEDGTSVDVDLEGADGPGHALGHDPSPLKSASRNDVRPDFRSGFDGGQVRRAVTPQCCRETPCLDARPGG